MSAVGIEVYCIGRTRVEHNELKDWMRSLGCSDDTINKLVYQDIEATDAAKIVSVAAKQCYMSFEVGMNPNVTRTRTNMKEYLDNVLAQRHGSVLEHVSWTFAINNVSRVFTGEMNRHRAGVAIGERSMRYIRFAERIDYWMPSSLFVRDNDDDDMRRRKIATQDVFERAFKQMQENYKELVAIWEMDEEHRNFKFKKTMTSCFRRIIGMGCATGGIWTFNARALRHVLEMRCDEAAEEEINLVASTILNKMIEDEPYLFGDFNSTTKKPKYSKV